MSLKPGDRIERYVIDGLLGVGGMGEVYRAHDSRLQRSVALKLLREEPSPPGAASDRPSGKSGNLGSRLLREARAAAALSHPNVIAIYDVGQIESPEELRGTTYLAMELVEGVSLRKEVGGTASIADRQRWLADIASALAAAHDHGLIHRDIKPENVMIRDDGRVTVLDFGIAKKAGGASGIAETAQAYELSTETAAGVAVGTPLYMAPEQLLAEELDGRADQFAWGVLAYELLSGELPWNAEEGALLLVTQILHKSPKPLSSFAQVPPALAAVVMRALSKSREARFRSMREIAAELGATSQQFSRGLAPAAPRVNPDLVVTHDATVAPARQLAPVPAPEPAPPSTTTTRRTRRWMAAAALAVAVLLPAAWLVSARGGHIAPRAASPPQAPSSLGGTNSPRARAAYDEAMRRFREGLYNEAFGELQAALDADPGFAAAHLRMGLLTIFLPTTNHGMRLELGLAAASPSGLDSRDRDLLEAFQLVAQKEPDFRAAEERLARLVERAPDDAEAALWLGVVRRYAYRFREALEALERAQALDRDNAVPLWLGAASLAFLGRMDEATSMLEECARRFPRATLCVMLRARLAAERGDCASADRVLGEFLERAPNSTMPRVLRADALYALGRKADAVRALNEAFPTVAAPSKGIEPLYRAGLAVLQGRLDLAAAGFEQLVPTFTADDAEMFRYVTNDQAHIYLEMGRPEDAGRATRTLLDRGDDADAHFDIVGDQSINTAHLALLGGAISREDYVGRRSRWVEVWRKRMPRAFDGMLWQRAYGGLAATPEEANEAVAARARFSPPPSRRPTGDFTGAPALLMAGLVDEALPELELAASSCTPITDPWGDTRAHELLGQARAAKLDKARACAEYGIVLDRWGAAKPQSVTATRVRERARALGCRP